MTDTAHTPTPWAVQITDRWGNNGSRLFYTAVIPTGDTSRLRHLAMADGSFHVCRTSHTSSVDCAALHSANAAHIVKCVNEAEAKDKRIAELEAALNEAWDCLSGEPEYHHSGMGCGLEDRNITDRYEAMEHGWEAAMERVYSEHINHAIKAIDAAIAKAGEA